jgi:hypothetical protein
MLTRRNILQKADNPIENYAVGEKTTARDQILWADEYLKINKPAQIRLISAGLERKVLCSLVYDAGLIRSARIQSDRVCLPCRQECTLQPSPPRYIYRRR